MLNHPLNKTIFAGITATFAMSAFASLAPLMGMPPMNPPAMLAGAMGAPIAAGWLAHLMIGTILALGYSFIAHRIPGPSLTRGPVYSILPWLMAQTVVMPMMGAGLFSGSAALATGSLVGHIVFGAVLSLTLPQSCATRACAIAHA